MSKKGCFLAVHRGHDASCALMKDGEIIAATMEERFSRVKGDTGYPKQSIDLVMRCAGVTGADLLGVAYTTRSFPSIFTKSKHRVNFSIADYINHYERHGGSFGRTSSDRIEYLKWLRDGEKFNNHENYFDFSFLDDNVLGDTKLDNVLFQAEQRRVLGEQLGVDPKTVQFLDHHTCHAHYAYFASPYRGKDCAIVVIDGGGDGRNQTVWLATGDKLKLVAESKEADICALYKLTTLLLGMRPDRDEFKVMGLAPYAKSQRVQDAYARIKSILAVVGMKIVHNEKPQNLYEALKKHFAEFRFDDIAGAIQQLSEELMVALVNNVVKHTGTKRLVLSGGISLNIKANHALVKLGCVDELYVSPSGGDESLSLGGCYVLNEGGSPIEHVYLGYDVADDGDQIRRSVLSCSQKFIVRERVTNQDVANILAAGGIVGCIRGRAEFGVRGLGNRSILADPRSNDAVRRINEAIKNRDFWMPFAFSILEDRASEYLVNPNSLSSPFMTLGFDTVPSLRKSIVAGIHPYDFTARPQMVSKRYSGEFYQLISEFSNITGVPALLNTSFNLHGEPIVNNFADALRTFEKSDLDHLLVENTLISKSRE